ncbi:MAG: RNA polymerase sigma factor [Gammaproteobacteria bacterium]|nr:RNA polymerase sigma factor [Gammaproteobacteria bacterium]
MSIFLNAVIHPETVRRLKTGDRAALETVYKVFSKAVYTTARRILKDSGLAEEVAQDTFVDVMTKASTLRDAAALGPWVRSIVVNRCLMRLRSPWHKRREHRDGVGEYERPRPDDDLHRAIDIEQALDRLPAETRAVIWMHDIEGYTHREIGAAFGRTASFSKSQLARGYEKLTEFRTGETSESRNRTDERAKLERTNASL